MTSAPGAPGTSAIDVRGIVKRFGNHIAVDDISFTVPRGVVYGILGPNGAGKSTTLRMINDIIAPDRGTITILDGIAPGLAAASKIGYLPEERGLYPKMKVTDAIEFLGELRGLDRKAAKTKARHWLDRLGLAKWADNKVQDLSKGMQQKVQFATALLHDPEIVILDEPWSGLDPINADVLREVVEELRSQRRTVLFSTHQMEQAEKVCDDICIIARGKKVLDGNLRELKKAAASDGLVALAFTDDQARAAAEAVLADRAVIAEKRPPRAGEVADCEVKLADDATPEQLMSLLIGRGARLRLFEVVVPSLHQIFVAAAGDAAAVAERLEAPAGSINGDAA